MSHVVTCNVASEDWQALPLTGENRGFENELTILYTPFQITFTLNTSSCGQPCTREAALLLVIDLRRFL